MGDQKKTVLISTLYTQAHGGVYTMLNFLIGVLKEMGFNVKIAYYMPYSVKSDLSVPFKKLFRKKTHSLNFVGELGVAEYAIGTFLPELEFINYYPNRYWKSLIDESSLHIVITGHILSALPFYITKKKYLAWVATPYQEDRENRVKQFSLGRQLIDDIFISKVGHWLEKKILSAGMIFSISHYSKKQFKSNEKLIQNVISVPIDADAFYPQPNAVKPGLICFSGRFLDPRKNMTFLFQAFSMIYKKITYARLCLIGDEVTQELTEKLNQFNIRNQVGVFNYIPRDELILKLQQTDVFIIPSYQEGLCIAGLEAMACGCPVVSTKCGGPSDYIVDSKNGYLVNFDVIEFSNKIIKIIENRELRNQMSQQAVKTISENYSINSVKKRWVQAIQEFERYKTC